MFYILELCLPFRLPSPEGQADTVLKYRSCSVVCLVHPLLLLVCVCLFNQSTKGGKDTSFYLEEVDGMVLIFDFTVTLVTF